VVAREYREDAGRDPANGLGYVPTVNPGETVTPRTVVASGSKTAKRVMPATKLNPSAKGRRAATSG